MSHLWTERVNVALCPDRLIVVRYSRGLRPKEIHREIVPCPEGEREGGWQAALAALRRVIGQSAPASATVVLSNHFVRYALAPWRAELGNEAEWRSYISNFFREIYGSAAQRWDFRWSDANPHNPCLACAIDTELLDQLRDACATGGWRLQSVQPHLMSSFNYWRRHLGPEPSWLVLVEPGKLCLLRIEQGCWRWVRCVRMASPSGPSLDDMLARAQMLLGGTDAGAQKVLLHRCDDGDPAELAAGPSWTTRDLLAELRPDLSQPGSRAFSMALLA